MGTEHFAEADLMPESFADFGGFPAEIDRYRITGLLGRGSMGVVLRAHDEALDRPVALKLLRLDVRCRTDVSPTEAQSVARRRFVYEAQLMARLSHPNVVEIYDVGTWGEHVFIAMKLVEGETLDAWLAVERPRSEIIEVFAQAAEGLAAAHRAGIIHRDFKPNNVIVGRDGTVCVMDFGLATLAGECSSPRLHKSGVVDRAEASAATLTQIGMSVGTPAYMPPEQHHGRCLDGRSDQFAFCCALYEALHGLRPYEGDDPDHLLRAKLERRRQRGRSAPRWLSRIAERGMSPRPQDRFASMEDLLAALHRLRLQRIVRRGVLVFAMLAVMVGSAVPAIAITARERPEREHHAAHEDRAPRPAPSAEG